MKLYLDEDVLPLLASMVRMRGYDVNSAHEIGRRGLSDEDHLAYATQQERVLVSYNIRDYTRLARTWFAGGREHAGIVLGYRQFSRARVGTIVRALTRLLNTVTELDMRNAVRYIEEFLS